MGVVRDNGQVGLMHTGECQETVMNMPHLSHLNEDDISVNQLPSGTG